MISGILEQILTSGYKYFFVLISVWSVGGSYFALIQSVNLAVIGFTMFFMSSIYINLINENTLISQDPTKINFAIRNELGVTFALVIFVSLLIYLSSTTDLAFAAIRQNTGFFLLFFCSYSILEASRKLFFVFHQPLSHRAILVNYHVASIARLIGVSSFSINVSFGKSILALHSLIFLITAVCLALNIPPARSYLVSLETFWKSIDIFRLYVISAFSKLYFLLIKTKSWIAEASLTFFSRQLFLIVALSQSPPLVIKEYSATIATLNVLNFFYESIPTQLAPKYKAAINASPKKYLKMILSHLTFSLMAILSISLAIYSIVFFGHFEIVDALLRPTSFSSDKLAVLFFVYCSLICLNRFLHVHLAIHNRKSVALISSVLGLLYAIASINLVNFQSFKSLLLFTILGYFLTFLASLLLELIINTRLIRTFDRT